MTYENVIAKQLIECWGGGKGFDAADQIRLHLEVRFDAGEIHIISAADHGSFLMLRVATDKWVEPREFGLLSDGSFVW